MLVRDHYMKNQFIVRFTLIQEFVMTPGIEFDNGDTKTGK